MQRVSTKPRVQRDTIKPRRSNPRPKPPLDEGKRLLYSLADAAAVLDTSTATLRRLIADGVILGVRINPRSPTAKVYVRADEVRALALGGTAKDKADA